MARIRKTLNLASLLKRVNHKLLHSTCSGDVRRGMADILGVALIEANVYSGYGYLTRGDLQKVHNGWEDPGIEFRNAKGEAVLADEYYADQQKMGMLSRYTKTYPDESRRHYYVHTALSSDYHKLADDGEK